MINSTIEKFGYPATLICEYDHWVVLLRPAQVTLGSLVVAAKSDAENFGDLSPEHFTELKDVTTAVEAMLKSAVSHDKTNWLMLMMVDPHVHFHVFPRYDGSRQMDQLEIKDAAWPAPPDLKSALPLGEKQILEMKNWLQSKLP